VGLTPSALVLAFRATSRHRSAHVRYVRRKQILLFILRTSYFTLHLHPRESQIGVFLGEVAQVIAILVLRSCQVEHAGDEGDEDCYTGAVGCQFAP